MTDTQDVPGEAGKTAGAVAGALSGAELGTKLIPVPFVGTVVGAVVGGAVGSEVGSAVGSSLHEGWQRLREHTEGAVASGRILVGPRPIDPRTTTRQNGPATSPTVTPGTLSTSIAGAI